MKLLLPTLLLVMCALPIFAQMPKIEPGVSHDLAIRRSAHYSDVRYKLDLTLEKMSPVLKGTIEIRLRVNPQAADPSTADFTSPIILEWRKIAGHEKDSAISNVTINGVVLKGHEGELYTADSKGAPYYILENDHIIFRDELRPGENFIKLDFTSPILTSGSAITRYIDKEDGSEYLYSLFVPRTLARRFRCSISRI